MRLNLHISTCPNDTFMFEAMLHQRIDVEGLEFDLRLSDIEELNSQALAGNADVTKISYAIIPEIVDQYQILTSGSALGRGNGPLLVSKGDRDKTELKGLTVAIPGKLTTANLLLGALFPEIGVKKEYLFSEVAGAIERREVDAGVLIHEGRFVYKDKGLSLVADLGLEWEARYGLPLPLGAIAVKRSLPEEVRGKIDRVLRRSIEYAFAHPTEGFGFIKRYAQELDDAVIGQHIDLFVNRYSLDIGEEGRKATRQLLGDRLTEGEWDGVFVG